MTEDEIAFLRKLAEEFAANHGGGSIGRTLGSGGSAAVFLWETEQEKYALKVYNPKFFTVNSAPAEKNRVELQRRLIGKHCESIVDTLAIHEVLQTCFIQMEYFPGEELKKVLGKVPDEAVEGLIKKVVEAVKYLENLKLVHRDIKPENILVSDDFSELKLLDLGVVREISVHEDKTDGTDHGVKRPFIATAQYSSPEYLFRLEAPSTALWKALTIYQVGAVLHDLVCKRPLFEKEVAADNKYALAMAVMRDMPDFTGASSKLSSWTALASRCLTKDSGLRMQLVDWPDFSAHTGSAKDRLKRALEARASSADRAEVNETNAISQLAARRYRLTSIAEELRAQLIKEYSNKVRISLANSTENRASFFLMVPEVTIGVKVAIEFSWESGLREQIANVRLAAMAELDNAQAEFNGERQSIGEIDMNGVAQPQLLELLMEAVSDLLVKYTELVDITGIASGTDLVPLTWQKNT